MRRIRDYLLKYSYKLLASGHGVKGWVGHPQRIEAGGCFGIVRDCKNTRIHCLSSTRRRSKVFF